MHVRHGMKATLIANSVHGGLGDLILGDEKLSSIEVKVAEHSIFLKVYFIQVHCRCPRSHQRRASDPITDGCEPP